MIDGSNGHTYYYGGSGNDSFWGGNGTSCVFTGTGHNVVTGSAGYDIIYATQGHNEIYLGGGNDTVYGGNAALNTIWGGDGNDTFVYVNTTGATSAAQLHLGHDVIYGFAEGHDKINLGSVSTFISTWSNISSVLVSYDHGGTDKGTVIQFNADSTITLVGVDKATLNVNDFQLS